MTPFPKMCRSEPIPSSDATLPRALPDPLMASCARPAAAGALAPPPRLPAAGSDGCSATHARAPTDAPSHDPRRRAGAVTEMKLQNHYANLLLSNLSPHQGPPAPTINRDLANHTHSHMTNHACRKIECQQPPTHISSTAKERHKSSAPTTNTIGRIGCPRRHHPPLPQTRLRTHPQLHFPRPLQRRPVPPPSRPRDHTPTTSPSPPTLYANHCVMVCHVRALLLLHAGHLYCLMCSALAGVIFTHLPWYHFSQMSHPIQNSSAV